MSFTSKASQHQAELTVGKLFSDILHTQPSSSTTKNDNATQLSSTQILTHQLHPSSSSSSSKAKSQKKSNNSIKKKKLQKIKKRETEDKKFQKFIKYNQILSKPKNQQTESDKAYIGKLIRKNTNQIKNLTHIDDFEIESELDVVKSQLLADLQPKSQARLRKKLTVPNSRNRSSDYDGDGGVSKQEFIDFDDKVKRGLISMPGLTPGLAPVDENESESDTE
ncbi:RRT14 [Candida margitis]|uniref:RRT14 n=1 Tax=Candida margitis TaxID=1775924 RepID=UPI002225E348|nr:RRT14 [Candida margitis]KAI5967284.1 RRT14 [Candida margitis]